MTCEPLRASPSRLGRPPRRWVVVPVNRCGPGTVAPPALLRLAAAVCLCAQAAACSTAFNPSAQHEPQPFGPWQPLSARAVAVELGGADPPEAVAARERVGARGQRVQEVVLENNTFAYGENKLIVATRRGRGDRPAPAGMEAVRFEFTPATVRENVERLLNGARVQGDPVVRRNRYGVYHFVPAEYDGAGRCIYAWQVVDGRAAPAFGASAATETSVQLRYCDSEADPQELIEMFDDLAITA